MRFSTLLCVVAFVLAAPVADALADGCKFPEVAVPKMPAIPHQRALIRFKDGVETLVVESTYETESPSVGWVLPLPAEPTALEVADPGMLTSLSMCLQPRITHGFDNFVLLPLVLGAAAVPLVLAMIFLGCPFRLLTLLVFVLVVLLAVSILVPTLGIKRSGSQGMDAPEGIEEISTQRVGNYDVTVLKATRSDALSEWLAKASLKPLDEKARAVVDDYVVRRWCFLVARLRKDAAGRATPHPIAATFPVEQPVYPMKMTGLADTKTRVELFVVSEGSAAADEFDCVSSASYEWAQGETRGVVYYGAFCKTRDQDLNIGSPDALEHMWPGCVVTKLAADLSPEQMARDVEIDVGPFRRFRRHYYSAAARRNIAGAIALWGLVVVLVGLGTVFRGRRRPERWALYVLFIIGLGTAVASGVVYAVLPVVPVETRRGSDSRYVEAHARGLCRAAQWMVEEGHLNAGMSKKDLARFPETAVRDGMISPPQARNPLTGETMRRERSPGNFSIRRDGGETYVCFYGRWGRELRAKIPTKDEPPPVRRQGGR